MAMEEPRLALPAVGEGEEGGETVENIILSRSLMCDEFSTCAQEISSLDGILKCDVVVC